MGAAVDLENEGLRRLLVNACYWAIGLEDKIPAKSQRGLRGRIQTDLVWLWKVQARREARGLKTEGFGRTLIPPRAVTAGTAPGGKMPLRGAGMPPPPHRHPNLPRPAGATPRLCTRDAVAMHQRCTPGLRVCIAGASLVHRYCIPCAQRESGVNCLGLGRLGALGHHHRPVVERAFGLLASRQPSRLALTPAFTRQAQSLPGRLQAEGLPYYPVVVPSEPPSSVKALDIGQILWNATADQDLNPASSGLRPAYGMPNETKTYDLVIIGVAQRASSRQPPQPARKRRWR